MDKWCKYITELLADNDIKKGSNVLDAACGTGDIAIALGKYGCYVDAVDISSDMLIIAKEKTHNLGLNINYLMQDMRQIRSNTRYDAITCVNDGVNYLKNLDDVKEFFASANNSLKDYGLLIFDISTRYKLSQMDGEMYAEEVDDMAYIWANTFDEDSNCLTMDISFFTQVEDNLYEKTTEIHEQIGYSVEDISKCLDDTGFETISIYDELSKDRHCDLSQRVHFVCRKI